MNNTLVHSNYAGTKESNIVLKLLAYISIITASYDVVLTIQVAGFTVRLTQLSMIILIFLVFCNFINTGKCVWPVNYTIILIYTFLNTLFLINSIYITKAVGYDLWLVLDVISILTITNVFKNKKDIINLLKVYVFSFTFTAGIGIVEWITYKFGIYIFNSRYVGLNRIRIFGFCYEPSYYATYLIVGWCILGYLIETKNSMFFKYRTLVINFLIITIALILSTSRMGYLAMVFYILFRMIINIKKIVSYHHHTILVRLKNIKIVFLCVFIILSVILFLIYMYMNKLTQLQELMNGLGIFNTSVHSASERGNALMNTIKVFMNSPILGCSLGDIDGRIARNTGVLYFGQTLSMSIFAEAFAATGIIGGILFLDYIKRMVFIKTKNNKYLAGYDKQYTDMLSALSIGFAFQIILLNMNQNVLRPYVWIGIGIISVAYRGIKFFGLENQKENNLKGEL